MPNYTGVATRAPPAVRRMATACSNWDAVTGVFRNDEGFTMEEAVVESEAIKEAAKAKQIERRLELKKEKERAAEADRVAALYDSS